MRIPLMDSINERNFMLFSTLSVHGQLDEDLLPAYASLSFVQRNEGQPEQADVGYYRNSGRLFDMYTVPRPKQYYLFGPYMSITALMSTCSSLLSAGKSRGIESTPRS